jgi:hypothetical protein
MKKVERLTMWDITKRALEELEQHSEAAEFFEWKEDKQVDCLYHMIQTTTIDKLKVSEKVQIISDIKASLFDYTVKAKYKKWLKETA